MEDLFVRPRESSSSWTASVRIAGESQEQSRNGVYNASKDCWTPVPSITTSQRGSLSFSILLGEDEAFMSWMKIQGVPSGARVLKTMMTKPVLKRATTSSLKSFLAAFFLYSKHHSVILKQRQHNGFAECEESFIRFFIVGWKRNIFTLYLRSGTIDLKAAVERSDTFLCDRESTPPPFLCCLPQADASAGTVMEELYGQSRRRFCCEKLASTASSSGLPCLHDTPNSSQYHLNT